MADKNTTPRQPDDLVERLRDPSGPYGYPYGYQSQLACEAAARIREQEAEIEGLREQVATEITHCKFLREDLHEAGTRIQAQEEEIARLAKRGQYYRDQCEQLEQLQRNNEGRITEIVSDELLQRAERAVAERKQAEEECARRTNEWRKAEAERDEWHKAWIGMEQRACKSESELARHVACDAEQRKEIEGLRQDAERYRWLRDQCEFTPHGATCDGYPVEYKVPTLVCDTQMGTDAKVDAAIDAARKGKP